MAPCPSDHSPLGPSGAHRWLRCPGSVSMERGLADPGSGYASEGTKAHEAAARVLGVLRSGGDVPGACDEYRRGGDHILAEAVETYAGIVGAAWREALGSTPDALLLIERRVDLRDYVPGCWGTADAAVVGDDVLEVFDFKYGRGVAVSARDNAQMMCYALGFVAEYGCDYAFRRVRLHIVQPRLGEHSLWETDTAALVRWGTDTLRPGAARALTAGAPLAAGDWCRFCRARPRCPALAALVPDTGADPRLLGAGAVAEILRRLPVIKSWAGAVEAEAMRMAMRGEAPPGYKLVRGRSVRRVTNPAALRARLADAGVRAPDYLRPVELRPIGELEKTIGRKRLAQIAGTLIDKPAGAPVLVADDDPRAEFTPAGDGSELLDVEL